jgi:ATP-dependent DNA helicase RecQ
MLARTGLDLDEGELLQVLRDKFGYSAFRPGQLGCIRRTLQGLDQLMVLPTGSGKSLLYQVPACVLPGLTLVVSPLVALMEDQLRGLVRAGIQAACLHSGQATEVQAGVLAAAEAARLRVLLVAPERLATLRFQRSLSRMQVSLVAVDEAHCVSEWGHDFRPDYRRLGPVLAGLHCPILAMTATATEAVQQDICAALGIPEAIRTQLGVDRQNLRFGVVAIRQERLRIETLAGLAERFAGRSGLIYVPTRREADDLAFQLCRRLGERVISYHAGLPAEVRSDRQAAFQNGTARLLVATSAFGMGIDKPDVRFVLHATAPRSLEDYVQEAGRASRDGRPGVCCVVVAKRDFERLRSEARRSTAGSERREMLCRRVSEVERYAFHRGCRRDLLVSHFGHQLARSRRTCCDRCHRWRWAWMS